MITLLQASQGILGNFVCDFDSIMVNTIWGVDTQKTGMVGWWEMLIPASSALGGLLCLFLVARIAYNTMTLKKPLDILSLLRPLAIVIVLSNWYVITSSLHSISSRVEEGFKVSYEYNTELVDSLRTKRGDLCHILSGQYNEKLTEANISEMLEKAALHNSEEQQDKAEQETAGKHAPESTLEDETVEIFSDIMYDIGETTVDSLGNEQIIIDGRKLIIDHEVTSVIEKTILYIAEIIWAVGLYFVFFVKNLALCVLVIFGPIYFACSVLDPWKDKWSDWMGRFVTVSFYGVCAYIGLIISLKIIQYSLHGDIYLLSNITENENEFWKYIAFASRTFLSTSGMYIVSMMVGTAAIPLSFELATWIIPSAAFRGAADFYSGAMGFTGEVVKKTAKATAALVTAGAGAAVAGAGGAAAMEEKEVMDTWREMQDSSNDVGPEGQYGEDNGSRVSNSNGKDEDGKPLNDYRDSSNDANADDVVFAAHRWADRYENYLQQTNEQQRRTQTFQALDEDLALYEQAVSEGRAEEFVQEQEARANDNKLLIILATIGRLDLNLFNGSKAERNSFLIRHGLFKAYRRAERMEQRAAADEARGDRNHLNWRLRNMRLNLAEEIRSMVSDRSRDILQARGIYINDELGTAGRARFRSTEDILPSDRVRLRNLARKGNLGDLLKSFDGDKKAYRAFLRRFGLLELDNRNIMSGGEDNSQSLEEQKALRDETRRRSQAILDGEISSGVYGFGDSNQGNLHDDRRSSRSSRRRTREEDMYEINAVLDEVIGRSGDEDKDEKKRRNLHQTLKAYRTAVRQGRGADFIDQLRSQTLNDEDGTSSMNFDRFSEIVNDPDRYSRIYEELDRIEQQQMGREVNDENAHGSENNSDNN